jgi:hypothetical protein
MLYIIQMTGIHNAKHTPCPEVQSNVMLRFQPVNSPDGFLQKQHRHRTSSAAPLSPLDFYTFRYTIKAIVKYISLKTKPHMYLSGENDDKIIG